MQMRSIEEEVCFGMQRGRPRHWKQSENVTRGWHIRTDIADRRARQCEHLRVRKRTRKLWHGQVRHNTILGHFVAQNDCSSCRACKPGKALPRT